MAVTVWAAGCDQASNESLMYSYAGEQPAEQDRTAPVVTWEGVRHRRTAGETARPALYRAPPRLHSEPPMTTSPSVAQTDHFHLPRPRRFSTMSNVAKR